MACYAETDAKGFVTRVVVVSEGDEANAVEFLRGLYGQSRWRKTCEGGKGRNRFASVGCFYDAALDAFIDPQPYASWRLDAESCEWVPPVAFPEDGTAFTVWHELSQSWLSPPTPDLATSKSAVQPQGP